MLAKVVREITKVGKVTMSLNGKTILLTGATSGLGFDLAKALDKQNAKLAICGRSAEKMTNLVSELNLDASQLLSQTFDITHMPDANAFIEKVLNKFGNIDVLINCAGANSSRDDVANIDIHEFNQMMQLNVLAPLNMMQRVYKQAMLPRQQGMIINILSTVCLYANVGIGSYTASKSALDGLTKVFRKEARDHNVKICAIYPGGIDTPFRDAERPQYLTTEPVVNAVLTMMQQSENSSIDELVIRPMVERNFS